MHLKPYKPGWGGAPETIALRRKRQEKPKFKVTSGEIAESHLGIHRPCLENCLSLGARTIILSPGYKKG